jgi:hypothetical protein
MTMGQHVGIDLGGLTVTVATDRGAPTQLPASPGDPAAGVRAALAAAGTPGTVCIAAPDAWLSGAKAGAASQEELRHECEDGARTGRVGWAGQLAAVSAFAAADRGPGRYLVCDVGGTGVRAGLFTVSGATVRVEATHAEAGGGWREFEAALRADLRSSGSASALPANWYEQALDPADAERAAVVLEEAVTTGRDDALETRVYGIVGAGPVIGLTAGRLIRGFEQTERRLRAAVTAIRGGPRPDHVVLTGGLGWFPLAARTAVIAAGVASAGIGPMGDAPGDGAVVVGVGAAAQGALLFARGDVSLTPPAGREAVVIPVHRFREGQLEGVCVKLPWTESFASFPGGALTIDRDELEVLVGGEPRVARLRGLVPGVHQIGLRPAWPGPGVLVARPADGGRPHIVPLSDLEAR